MNGLSVGDDTAGSGELKETQRHQTGNSRVWGPPVILVCTVARGINTPDGVSEVFVPHHRASSAPSNLQRIQAPDQ